MRAPALLLLAGVLAARSALAEPTSNPPSAIVEVRGERARAPRGVGDVQVERDQLEASPRQRTSELLSAAPGFYVDHEDGEGLGNDVTLRGFDLEHGSGIELRLGSVPINSPLHVRGAGYADADFIIPEVVESIAILQGVYDPRQGDSAIVGSADFRLGVAERGTQLKLSYGSFNQLRGFGVVAPRSEHSGTFAAVAARRTEGFGQNREGRSGNVNAQYITRLGDAELRVFALANAAESALAGVVREDDVDAGRIGYLDSYPYFSRNQGVSSQRVLLGAELGRITVEGRRQRILPFFSWSRLDARQNYAGNLEASQLNPGVFGRGDLFETKNRELAVGILASAGSELRLGRAAALVLEPGLFFRAGHTQLEKNLLDPNSLERWDRRMRSEVTSLDLGAYFDAEIWLWKRFRVAGGPRIDLLARSIDDQLGFGEGEFASTRKPGRRAAAGVAVGPRFSLDYAFTPELSLAAAYGEGFRSLDPARIREGNSKPFTRVRSVEVGLRAKDRTGALRSSVALFQTWVGNELVFVAEEGGLETQNASIRRGLVTQLVLRTNSWLLLSTALSVTDAQYQTRVPGITHVVPNVPPLLWRADAVVEGPLGTWHRRPLRGRLGVGYTFAAPAHISDQLRGPATHALNAGARLRHGPLEFGLEGYNLLNLRAADTADRFISNWSLQAGQQPASLVVHTVAAPPRTVIASLGVTL